jgi:ABC-2 type transport system permease protein
MNKTSKIFTIIKHEYLTKVRSKGFIISTVLGPLMMIAIIAIPVIAAMFSGTDMKIGIVDNTGKYGFDIMKKDTTVLKLVKINESEKINREYLENKQNKKRIDFALEKDSLDGFLVIDSNFVDSSTVLVYTRGGGGIGYIQKIESAVSKVLQKEKVKAKNLDTSLIQFVEKAGDVKMENLVIGKSGKNQDNPAVKAIIGYVLGFFIYMMMLMYGSFVSRGVIEEKANRIVEVIASSVRPFQIMLGKVVGIGSVGLTQVVIWIIFASILFYFSGSIIQSTLSPNQIQNFMSMMGQGQQMQIPKDFNLAEIINIKLAGLIFYFIFFFLSGYFIYATLFAAVGSAVDQEQDAAQLQLPITLPIIIPILFIGNVISNPNGMLAIVLSLIPFFSPILMIVRIAAGEVPIWQIIASMVMVIGTFFGCLWIAAKIYRVGILMYGKKPSFRDVARWIRMAK